jgi:mRNA-degrading endonuclease toxin of MazEF toxin-antitoxin module
MTFQHGDVGLIPFPYSDLTARRARPAVVVSGAVYQSARSELLLAYISSQLSKATEPSLVVHQVGHLSAHDLSEVDRRLRIALSLTACALSDVVDEVDFLAEPPSVVQIVAEKAVTALVTFSSENNFTLVLSLTCHTNGNMVVV